MVKLYVNHLGWVAGCRKKGWEIDEIVYTDNRAAAKRFPDESDKELRFIARGIERQGHHLDKVVCRKG